VTSSDQQPRRSADDFHFGTDVHSADGRLLGTLRFVIVEGETFDARAIVVKEDRRFSAHYGAGAALMEDDIAVPLASVAEAGRERITLSISAAEARRLPPYLTYQYAPVGKGDIARMLSDEVGQIGFAPDLVEQAHKRLDDLEIRAGENVMLGSTGKKLGTVRDVVMDGGELAGIVIHPTGFFKEDVLLQVRFLGRSDDLALFAHLTEADLAHLQPFHPPVTD